MCVSVYFLFFLLYVNSLETPFKIRLSEPPKQFDGLCQNPAPQKQTKGHLYWLCAQYSAGMWGEQFPERWDYRHGQLSNL